jgi:hypothetical protein
MYSDDMTTMIQITYEDVFDLPEDIWFIQLDVLINACKRICTASSGKVVLSSVDDHLIFTSVNEDGSFSKECISGTVGEFEIPDVPHTYKYHVTGIEPRSWNSRLSGESDEVKICLRKNIMTMTCEDIAVTSTHTMSIPGVTDVVYDGMYHKARVRYLKSVLNVSDSLELYVDDDMPLYVKSSLQSCAGTIHLYIASSIVE